MNHYQRLGVNEDTKLEDIRKAYRRMAAKTHPDRGGKATDFHAVAEAWETLGDPTKRAFYDNMLHLAPGKPNPGAQQSQQTAYTSPPPTDDIFAEFLRKHGPQATQGTPTADPAEEAIRQEFIKDHGRAPGTRPSWHRSPDDWDEAPPFDSPNYNNWARESNAAWERYHEHEDKFKKEDAAYTRAQKLRNMKPADANAFLKEEADKKAAAEKETAAHEATQKREQPYRDALNKLPFRYQNQAPRDSRPGKPLRSLIIRRTGERIAVILPIIGVITILIASLIATNPHPIVAVVAGVVELALLAVPAWIAGVIIDSLFALGLKAVPKVTREQDIKNFLPKPEPYRYQKPTPRPTTKPTPKPQPKPTPTSSTPPAPTTQPKPDPAHTGHKTYRAPQYPNPTRPTNSASTQKTTTHTTTRPKTPAPPKPAWQNNVGEYWAAWRKLDKSIQTYAPDSHRKGLPLASLQKWDTAETRLAYGLIIATILGIITLITQTNFDIDTQTIRFILGTPAIILTAIGIRVASHTLLIHHLKNTPGIIPLELDQENHHNQRHNR